MRLQHKSWRWTRLLCILLVAAALSGLLAACSGGGKTPEGVELIKNGSFEAGMGQDGINPEGWGRSHYEASVDPPMKVELITGADAFEGSSAKLTVYQADDSRMTQMVSVEPGSIYHVTGQVAYELGAGSTGHGWISIHNSMEGTAQVSADGQWHEVSCFLQAEKGQTSVEIWLRLGGFGQDSSGWVAFDNVSMKKVSKSFMESAGGTAQSMKDILANNQPQEEPKEKEVDEATAALRGMTVRQWVAILYCVAYIAAAVLFFGLRKHLSLTKQLLVFGLIAAVLIRIVPAMVFPGYQQADMGLWRSWGNGMLQNGPWGLYGAGDAIPSSWGTFDYNPDYPPLYCMMLAIPMWIVNVVGAKPTSAFELLMLKAYPIIADIVLAAFVYKLGRKYIGQTAAVGAALLLAFNPALLYNSAIWGQVDSLFCIPVLLCFWYALRGTHMADRLDAKPKPIRDYAFTGIWFSLAVLIKPQALIFLPALFFPIFFGVGRGAVGQVKPYPWGKAWLASLACIGAALLTVYVGYLPSTLYRWGQNGWTNNVVERLLWPYHHLSAELAMYPRKCLNAINLWGLLGNNSHNYDYPDLAVAGKTAFQSSKDFWTFFGGVLGQYGGIALTALVSLLYWLRTRAKQFNWFMAGALALSTFFIFSFKIHERYLLPGLIFVFFAYAMRRDDRWIPLQAGMSGLLALNIMMTCQTTWLMSSGEYAMLKYGFYLFSSAVTVLLYLTMVGIACDPRPQDDDPAKEDEANRHIPGAPHTGPQQPLANQLWINSDIPADRV